MVEENSVQEAVDESGSEVFEGSALADSPESAESSIEQTGAFLKGLIEALLFVSDHPLELKEIARGARIDRARAQTLLDELRQEYEGRGIRLDEVGGGYAFRSSPSYADRVRQYLSLRPVRLSRAQLETLAIVAYRQPITRPEIDDIRGVDSGPVLKGLLERDLIRIIGKKDEPGRPMLYGTTPGFLEAFSLKSLRDLPTLREYTELSEESRQTFESELGESAPEGPVSFGEAAAGTDGEGQPSVESPQSALHSTGEAGENLGESTEEDGDPPRDSEQGEGQADESERDGDAGEEGDGEDGEGDGEDDEDGEGDGEDDDDDDDDDDEDGEDGEDDEDDDDDDDDDDDVDDDDDDDDDEDDDDDDDDDENGDEDDGGESKADDKSAAKKPAKPAKPATPVKKKR